MTLMADSVRIFYAKQAAGKIKKEIEQAGLENLKTLAERNISIVGTYLNGCSKEKKTEIKRDLSYLLSMGVTIDMILEQLGKKIPELAPLMLGREAYKKSELGEIERFLKS